MAQREPVGVVLDSNLPTLYLIVTGSRGWTDRPSVWSPLTGLVRANPGRRIVVRNGKCKKGLDLLVSGWTDRAARLGVEEIPYETDWDRFGNGAGHVRNQVMVDAGADLLMAWAKPCRLNRRWCPEGPHATHGTADCVGRARAAGIPVFFSPLGMSW